MSFGAGHWPYILILLVVVLIIWGPSKLPDLGSGLGRAIREFRKATSETKDSFSSSTPASTPPPAAAPAPAAPTTTTGTAPAPESKPPSV